MRKSHEKLLRLWSCHIGRWYLCMHTGRFGQLVSAEWRTRAATGGDWGVFLTLKDRLGEFTVRPAFVTEAEP